MIVGISWRPGKLSDIAMRALMLILYRIISASHRKERYAGSTTRSSNRRENLVLGEVFDVAVDLRKASPNFGRWAGEILSADNKQQLWIPSGFGHGFLVLSDTAEFEYKCTDYYAPDFERSIHWNDPDIGIDWPLAEGEQPMLSKKDALAPNLKDAETYA